MPRNHFDILILLGRPASGKSEIMDFLNKTGPIERTERFHVGLIDMIDDFPMLWTWFEEDAILEKIMNKPRVQSDKEGYFLHQYQWDLLIERICMEYKKHQRDYTDYHAEHTTLIEFSRGSEHGGYASAFQHLSTEVLERAAILYVDVSYEESLRKNRRRFNPERPDSILEHGLPDHKLERLYKKVDWEEVTAGHSEYLPIQGHRVPIVVLKNEPELTNDFAKLAPALEAALAKLWSLYSRK
ncbi:MAG TPA: hypothetical protein PLG50_01495 [bacterium]|nr:hypothetical protein [bacterium]HQG44317.1 hypothetical protein [bacterium]HQI48933.1 hypothetical protein [bacterium]HQJ64457.1 hypothetical protein [bacterium]